MTDTLTRTDPDTFRIERSIAIAAAPAAIYPLIEDFRRWTTWSPYENLDPKMQRTYSGAEHGLGAGYAWASKGKAGCGQMEIIGAEPASKVTIKLDFSKPFEASNTAEFTLERRGGETLVTWAMFGPKAACDHWLMKLMSIFFDMDKMVGRDFEVGLAKLRQAAEA